MADHLPPSAWQIEKSLALFLELRTKMEDDPSLPADEANVSRLTLPDGGTIATPRVLLGRLIDAAVWADRRADEAEQLKKRFQARQHRYETRKDAIRKTITDLMEILGVQAFEGEEGTASMAKGVPSVVVTDVDKLDPVFVKVTVTPDKIAIGKSLKLGLTVEGAELSNPAPSLRITQF